MSGVEGGGGEEFVEKTSQDIVLWSRRKIEWRGTWEYNLRNMTDCHVISQKNNEEFIGLSSLEVARENHGT